MPLNLFTEEAAPIVFGTAGTERMRIEAGGNMSLNGTKINFGSATGQMLNLYGTIYGIGVQGFRQYFRSDLGFSWYKGGVHSDSIDDPGAGGTTLMTLDETSGLKINGSAWNGRHLILGTYHFWVDGSGRLRVKNGAPLSDTDGTIVGLQG